jgi:hypothetical protein
MVSYFDWLDQSLLEQIGLLVHKDRMKEVCSEIHYWEIKSGFHSYIHARTISEGMELIRDIYFPWFSRPAFNIHSQKKTELYFSHLIHARVGDEAPIHQRNQSDRRYFFWIAHLVNPVNETLTHLTDVHRQLRKQIKLQRSCFLKPSQIMRS